MTSREAANVGRGMRSYTADMDSKRLSQERFGRYAASYVRSSAHAQGPDLERIVELVGEQPSWEALDIATGGGHTALAVAPHVAHVTATDITGPMLATAQKFIESRGATNIDFRSADAEDLPFAQDSFDLVTCRIAAHHFPAPDRFVEEVVRVLRPQGLFILQDMLAPQDPDAASWINRFEQRRDPSHHRSLSQAEWEHLLSSQAFTIETIDRFEKRLSLERWVSDQEGSKEDLAGLRELLRHAPEATRAWMRPSALKGSEAAFSIIHCVFSARSGPTTSHRRRSATP